MQLKCIAKVAICVFFGKLSSMTKHTDWLDKVLGGDSLREASKIADVPMRTLYSQREKGRITAENVIAIAIAYGHHPVGALVDTGYLDEKWAKSIDPMRALRDVDEEELADEVLRRMKLGKTNGALDTPIDELAAKRGQYDIVAAPENIVLTFEYDPEKMVAYRGPDEDKLREEAGEDWIDSP